jgi:hypothetical protein
MLCPMLSAVSAMNGLSHRSKSPSLDHLVSALL